MKSNPEAVPGNRTDNGPATAPVEASGILRILLVEDEALIRMVASAMLEDEGHVVLEAGNGSSALAMVAGDAAIDLLIIDLGLPDMSGAELVRQIRMTRPDIPVIIASGRSVDGQVCDMVELPKPYDSEMLKRAVAAAVAPG